VFASAPVLSLPDVPLLPFHEPDAVQLDAFVAFHVSVEAPPDGTLPGEAVNVSVGADDVTVTVAVFVTEPPAPVQVIV